MAAARRTDRKQSGVGKMAERENVEIETGGGGVIMPSGTSGNDKFYASGTVDYWNGGAGWDTVSYWYSTSAVGIYLNNMSANWGAAAGDVYAGVEVIDGSRFNDTLVGDAGANAFWGDAGNDYLSGGAGSDTLGGGSGYDTFAFAAALGTSNVDTINDFDVAAGEAILLSRNVFLNIREHELGIFDNAFTKGTAATSTSHRLIYNASTGELFYDADGVGGAAQIKFAVLEKGLALSAQNFSMGWF
jgi:Ca2+-binding RTX toxin-like protein